MAEHACQERLLLAERREMGRLRCSLHVPDLLVLARDRFVCNHLLESPDRFERNVEQPSRTRFAVPGDQQRRLELHAREHLAGVSRARAEPDAFGFEYDDGCAGARELARRGQAGVAGADDGDIDPFRYVLAGGW